MFFFLCDRQKVEQFFCRLRFCKTKAFFEVLLVRHIGIFTVRLVSLMFRVSQPQLNGNFVVM